MKIVKWDFHLDDSQSKHRYDMILGCDILSELKIDFFFLPVILRKPEARANDEQLQ